MKKVSIRFNDYLVNWILSNSQKITLIFPNL